MGFCWPRISSMSCFTEKKGMRCCSSNTSIMSLEGRLLHRFEHGRAFPRRVTSRSTETPRPPCRAFVLGTKQFYSVSLRGLPPPWELRLAPSWREVVTAPFRGHCAALAAQYTGRWQLVQSEKVVRQCESRLEQLPASGRAILRKLCSGEDKIGFG